MSPSPWPLNQRWWPWSWRPKQTFCHVCQCIHLGITYKVSILALLSSHASRMTCASPCIPASSKMAASSEMGLRFCRDSSVSDIHTELEDSNVHIRIKHFGQGLCSTLSDKKLGEVLNECNRGRWEQSGYELLWFFLVARSSRVYNPESAARAGWFPFRTLELNGGHIGDSVPSLIQLW